MFCPGTVKTDAISLGCIGVYSPRKITQNTILGIVLVCSNCHNKILEAAGLQQQKFIFSGSGDWNCEMRLSMCLGSAQVSLG